MWSLKEGDKDLKPKVFSNGKSQEDVVQEVLKAVNLGSKVIFIHGVCGSGKSAIALNIAKELGKTSIVVPIKNLQKQYEQDYMHSKEVFKRNNEKLNIAMITGRNNHPCLYLQENESGIRETRKVEVNAKLFNIFKKVDYDECEDIPYDKSADNSYIPCKIEIKEKNIRTLKKYYKENPDRKNIKDLDVKIMKRMAVAPACQYWCPILPDDLKISLEANKKRYAAINGDHSIFVRKPGCPYYKQFYSYVDADVIMFNSMQYLLETYIGRKPATEVEIIDECDEFLDKLAAEGTINLNRLRSESLFLFARDEEERKLIEALNDLLSKVIAEAKVFSGTEDSIIPVERTQIKELIKLFAKNDYLNIVQDEDSYIGKCSETCRRFYDLIADSYVSFYKPKGKDEFYVRLVTVNLDKIFNDLLDKNKIFVMMSGTLHSERVLKEIFGIKEFKIIEAETINQGSINKVKTGLEQDCKYENFRNGNLKREEYLRILDLCVKEAKRPTVVHVNAFADLPSEKEILELNLQNLVAKDKLMQDQIEDKKGVLVNEFKKGNTDLLFTTRCSRGIDFPFETCNSVVITKFPYPNTKSLFWQILKKQKPAFFWDFYKDKAHRELLQRIYRSVRHRDDHVDLLSPDIRVLETDVV